MSEDSLQVLDELGSMDARYVQTLSLVGTINQGPRHVGLDT